MSQKSQAFKCFKEWKALIEKQTKRKVKRLRTDNGLLDSLLLGTLLSKMELLKE